jgi:hypothetical protein
MIRKVLTGKSCLDYTKLLLWEIKKPMIFRGLLVIACINALFLKGVNWLV